MRSGKLFLVFFCLAVSIYSSSCFANNQEAGVVNTDVFEKADLSELTDVIKVTGVEEWNGQDRLIRAKGTFSPTDEEKITRLLHAKSFEDSDDITFITGDDDSWWDLDGNSLNSRNFVKSVAGQDTFIKLITLNSGQRRFLLEQTDF